MNYSYHTMQYHVKSNEVNITTIAIRIKVSEKDSQNIICQNLYNIDKSTWFPKKLAERERNL